MSADVKNPQKMLDYIKRSAALVAQLEKQAAAQTQKEAAVDSMIPGVVKALVSNGRIPEELSEKAAAQLKDHTRTLEILSHVCAHRTDEEMSHLGTPVKQASVKKASPYVGARNTAEKESDVVLLTRLGIR